jgi:hypothetical protein
MICLSVNCRGGGRPAAVQELGLLVKTWKPAVVFLMETRLSEERAWGLMKSLGYPNGEVAAASGLSGGLALFWKRDVTVALQSKSRSHIDVALSCDILNGKQWRFTGFYGEPRRELRKIVGTLCGSFVHNLTYHGSVQVTSMRY